MRLVSVVEAISFLVLLVFGSLLSRISDVDLVMPLGVLHGVLFVAFLAQLAQVWHRARWSVGRVALFVLYSVLPGGGFLADRSVRRDEASAAAAVAA